MSLFFIVQAVLIIGSRQTPGETKRANQHLEPMDESQDNIVCEAVLLIGSSLTPG
jgi:hypothetical protein